MARRNTDTDGSRRETRRSERQQAREAFDLAGIDGAVLLETLTRVTEKGGAIRLGLTRDGGALAVGVYGDGSDPYTEYVRPGEDVNAYLTGLGFYFDGLPMPPDGERLRR